MTKDKEEIIDLEGEEWRSVGIFKGIDFTGYYEISNKGRVRSVDRYINFRGNPRFQHGVLLSPHKHKGYWQVMFSKDGVQTNVLLHQAIAKAFIPNPNNYGYVNHKDENRSNNDVNNLEWCTFRYNLDYGTRVQRSAEKQSTPIIQLNIDGTFVKEWKSSRDAERNGGFVHGSILKCIDGVQNTHKSFVWITKEKYESMDKEDVMLYCSNIANKIDVFKVVQLDTNGNILKIWKNTKELEDSGYSIETLYSCFGGDCKTYKGSIFIKECKYREMTEEERFNFIESKKPERGIAIPILQLDRNCNIIKRWNCAWEARNFGYSAQAITSCVNKKIRQYKGFAWIKESEYENIDKDNFWKLFLKISKPIVQLDSSGNLVKTWESFKSAKSEGYNDNKIRECIRGIESCYKGFKWMYLSDYENLNKQ